MSPQETKHTHAWLGWMSEYPEDGFVIVDAASRESALAQVSKQMNGDATGEDVAEVSVAPVLAKHVYQMAHESHEECEPKGKRTRQAEESNAALLAAVEGLVAWMDPDYDALAAEFHRETGMMAPGKDEPAAMNSGHTYEERRQRWSEWCGVRRAALLSQARAAVALVKGGA